MSSRKLSRDNFTDRLRAFMTAKNLNNKQLAKTIEIDPAQIGRWLNGALPKLDKLEQLKRRFPDLNMNWLIYGEGEMSLSEMERAYNRLKKEIPDLQIDLSDLEKEDQEVVVGMVKRLRKA